MKRIAVAIALLVGSTLVACTASQVSMAVADVQAACITAIQASNTAAGLTKGGAANTVASINAYLVAGCATADAVAKLAADPTSVAWLNQQTGALQAIAAAAK
jgi:hypothetical protein